MRREIVVIFSVLAIPLLLLLPYLLQQKAKSQRLFCEMRQWHTSRALLEYEQRFGRFPGYRNLQAVRASGQRQATSWVFPALPYLHPVPSIYHADDQATTPQDDGSAEIFGPYDKVLAKYGSAGPDDLRGETPTEFVQELICPANRPSDFKQQPTWMSYVANCGMPDAEATAEYPTDWPANGVFLDRFMQSDLAAAAVSVTYLEQHDGKEYVLLLAENVDSGLWTDVEEAQVGFVWVANFIGGEPDPGDELLRINQQIGKGDGSTRFARPSSYHPDGVNVVYASGRTEFLNEKIDYLAYARMMISSSHEIKRPGSNQLIPPPYRLISSAVEASLE